MTYSEIESMTRTYKHLRAVLLSSFISLRATFATSLCSENIFERQYPQFQIIAAAKTGSTSLYSYLCQHSSIACLSKKKETNLLRGGKTARNEKERKKALKSYLRQGFNERKVPPSKFVTFEASIHYYHHKIARDNMYTLLPCTRLIWILRNPLPRAASEYLHQAVKSKVYPEFVDLLSAELGAIRKCSKNRDIQLERGFDNSLFRCLAKFKLKKFMISSAFYAYFINAWVQKFPREYHFFLDYEDFRSNPQMTVERLSSFLGIPPPPTLNYTWVYNKANTMDGKAAKLRSKLKIPPSLQSELQVVVSPFVKKLYEIIQTDFEWNVSSLI